MSDFPSELLAHGIISAETLRWFAPLWAWEEREARDLEEEARFFIDWEAGGSPDDAEQAPGGGIEGAGHGGQCAVLHLGGHRVEYCRERSSTAHGDAIWAASVSAALHVRAALAEGRWPDAGGGRGLADVRFLELGAGIGIPSLFLAHALGDAASHARPARPGAGEKQIFVSDIRAYHNLKQLLRSVSRHPHRALIKVVPHTWGEACSGREGESDDEPAGQGPASPRGSGFIAAECGGRRFDVVLASDCIYNPAYHDALLQSIARALARPSGRAVVTFSLHANTAPANVYAFFDAERLAEHGLASAHVRTEDMEDAMRELGLFRSNMSGRWVVHIHELAWIAAH